MVPRSWLYVPGDRPDRFDKAVASGADQVVLDLEDSVAPLRKQYARDAVCDWLSHHPGTATVRINDPAHEEGRRDLDQILSDPGARARLHGFRIPKVEDPALLRYVGDLVDQVAVDCVLHPLVETALGVLRLPDLVQAHPRLRSVGLGAGDLVAGLAVGAGVEALQWAEGALVFQSAAGGLDSPPMSVHPDVRDLDALSRTSRMGRARGFHGRSAVHPTQVPIINDAFTPEDDEVVRARAVVEALADPEVGVTLTGGRIADAATVKHAERVLALADTYANRSTHTS
jgi:citrate lyase subunit beta/citryl-CoA lyase